MSKLFGGVIDALKYKDIDATFEELADIFWLYTIMQEKNGSFVQSQNQTEDKNPNSSNHNEEKIEENVEENVKQNIPEITVSEKDNNNKPQTFTVSQTHEQQVTTEKSVPKGEYVRVPTHRQFEKYNKFAKSFKILRQFVNSNVQYTLDIDKSIEYIANTNIWDVAQKPQKELKYELYLVIEVSKSMEIYDEVIEDFIKALNRFSIFKKVKVYYLKQTNNSFEIYRDIECKSKTSLSIFSSYTQRNFTMILSDCISKGWSDKRGYKLLQDLSSFTALSILNLLPKSSWRRTTLKNSRIVRFTHKNGFKNAKLFSSEYTENNVENIKVPMLVLEPTSVKEWCKLQYGTKKCWASGSIFEAKVFNVNPNEKSVDVANNSAEDILDNFNRYSTPTAKKLAIYLSCVPLSMDIMKIVQKESLKEANYTHLAEVFLGGLLKKSKYKTKSGDIIYEFIDGVKEILFKKLALYKKIEILSNNSSFIANNLGSFIDFQALMENPTLKSGIALTDNDKIFAQIVADVFEEVGGEHKKLADEITKTIEKSNLEEKIIIPTSKRFQMGSDDGLDNEKPVHEVVFNYDFEIAKYPITVGEFRAFIEDTGYKTEAERGDGAYILDGENWHKKKDAYWDNPYFEQTDKHPVVCVSWNDAKEYCKWLSQKTGENYRLPTEAEWEYSCRAGTTTKWSFGYDESELKKYAWYRDNSKGITHEVGQKLPNPWGLYDMHGNVWEWCEDWYDEDEKEKVLRGGSWGNSAVSTRSSGRLSGNPTNRDDYWGFRVLRTLHS
jgi:formylglycine-generating enzyme required for sulfatase activity